MTTTIKDLKSLFKSAAISASTRPGPLQDFYIARVAKGIRPTMARLTLARKIATITLTIWKKGVSFDPQQLASASSMSLSGEQAFPSRVILCGGFGRVLEMLGSRGVSVNEIWPCVPSAPSHPLHAMPLRITRNSHRPRASDRTMVAMSTSLAYRSFELDSIATVRAGKLTSMGNQPS